MAPSKYIDQHIASHECLFDCKPKSTACHLLKRAIILKHMILNNWMLMEFDATSRLLGHLCRHFCFRVSTLQQHLCCYLAFALNQGKATLKDQSMYGLISAKWNMQYCVLEQENQIYLISLIMNMTVITQPMAGFIRRSQMINMSC